MPNHVPSEFSQWPGKHASQERLLEQFERAFAQGDTPNLDDYLPDSEDRSSVLIDLICADMKHRFERDERVRVESYLDKYPELKQESSLVVDLIAREYELRSSRHPDHSPAEYVSRFPQFREELTRRLSPDAEVESSVGLTTDFAGAENDADSTTFSAPIELPGYTILEELGRGGMGVVFQARHNALNREVAIKMILAGRLAGEEQRDRFLREAQVIARLQHPNIVQIFEIGDCGDKAFLALEYCPGGSLANELSGRPIDPRGAAQLVATLAAAIHAAHQAGVVHRDLKPANILLGSREEKSVDQAANETPKPNRRNTPHYFRFPNPDSLTLKITDFGLAKVLDDATEQTSTGAVMGTPSYMAPEQARGEAGAISAATDVWALGAVLYELLTGNPPFKGATVLETLEQVRNKEPVPPRQLQPKTPRDLETICLKCLQKEAGKRYGSAEAFAEDLQRYLKGETIQARPVSAVEKTVRWCRRKPVHAALIAALSLLVGGAIAAGVWYQDSQARRTLLIAEQEKKEAVRLARVEGDIEKALQTSTTFLDQAAANTENLQSWRSHLTRVESSLNLAETLANKEPGRIHKDLVQRLGEFRSAWQAHEKDYWMVDRLKKIRLEQTQVNTVTSQFEMDLSYPKIQEAFHRYEIDIGKTPVTQAISKIMSRPPFVRSHLTSALDNYLWWNPKEEVSKRNWVLAVAEAFDVDPWRRQVRRLIAERRWDDLKGELRRLRGELRDMDVNKQPPAFLIFIAKRLPPDMDAEKVDLLRRIARAYPSDFWANHELAFALGFGKSPRYDESARHFAVAAALMPDNAGVQVNLGYVLEELGEVEKATEAYRRAARLNPEYPVAFLNLGEILHKQDKLDEAYEKCRHGLDLAVHPRLVAIGHTNLCGILRDQGKWDAAAKEIKAAITLLEDDAKKRAAKDKQESNPPDLHLIQAHLAYANLLEEKKDFKAAEIVFRIALKLDPHFSRTYNNYGLNLYRRNKLSEAAEYLRQAIRKEPSYVEAYGNLGMVLRDLNQLEEAKRILEKALQIDAKTVIAHVNLGAVLYKMKMPHEAIFHFRYAIRLAPRTLEPYVNLGVVYDEMGQQPLARSYFEQAIKQNKKSPAALVKLARLLQNAEQFELAETAAKQAVLLRPDNSTLHFANGEILEKRKKWFEAEQAYRRVLKLDSGHFTAQHRLGIVLHAQRKVAEAMAAWQKAIAIKKEFADPYYSLAVALIRSGQEADGLEYSQKAVRYDPNFADAYVNIGYLLLKKRDLKESITASQKAVALNPKMGEAYINLGGALMHLGKLPEAVKAYRDAVRSDPKNAEYHYYLSDGLRKTGDIDGAIAELRLTVKWNPEHRAAYENLGVFLMNKNETAEAAKVFQQTIERFPSEAKSYINLTACLQRLGRLQESFKVCQSGRQRVPRNHPHFATIVQAAKLAQHWVKLEKQLPAIVAKKVQPANPDEWLQLVVVCKFKKLYVTGAKLAVAAFAKHPELAGNIKRGYRFKAAQVAVLSGAGQGPEGKDLIEKERQNLRQQALKWMQADLKAIEELATKKPQQEAKFIAYALRQWRENVNLRYVREPEHLQKLPEAERTQWREFWTQAGNLIKKNDA